MKLYKMLYETLQKNECGSKLMMSKKVYMDLPRQVAPACLEQTFAPLTEGYTIDHKSIVI